MRRGSNLQTQKKGVKRNIGVRLFFSILWIPLLTLTACGFVMGIIDIFMDIDEFMDSGAGLALYHSVFWPALGLSIYLCVKGKLPKTSKMIQHKTVRKIVRTLRKVEKFRVRHDDIQGAISRLSNTIKWVEKRRSMKADFERKAALFDGYLKLAQLHQEVRQYDSVEKVLRNAERLVPKPNAEQKEQLSNTLQECGKLAEKHEEFVRAIKFINRAKCLGKLKYDTMNAVARCFAHQDSRDEEAVSFYINFLNSTLSNPKLEGANIVLEQLRKSCEIPMDRKPINVQVLIEYNNRVKKVNPKLGWPSLNLGKACLHERDHKKARNYFLETQNYKPEMIATPYYIGLTSYKIGEFDEAIKHLNECLPKYSNRAAAELLLGVSKIGKFLFQTERQPKNLSLLKEAESHINFASNQGVTAVYDVTPSDVKSYLGWAHTYLNKNDEAVKNFKEAFVEAHAQEDESFFEECAKVLAKTRDIDDVISILRIALEQAIGYAPAASMVEGILEKASTYIPDNIEIGISRISLAIELGHILQAIELMNKAADMRNRMHPSADGDAAIKIDASLSFLQGRIVMRHPQPLNFEEAIRHLEQSQGLAEKSTNHGWYDKHCNKTEYWLGVCHAHLHNFDDAEKRLKAVLDRTPSNVDAMAQIGMVFLARDELDRAEEMFDKALAIEPRYAAAMYGRAKVLELGGDSAAASNFLLDLTKDGRANMKPSDSHYIALAFCSLGRMAENNNQQEEAVKFYDEALRLQKDFGLAHQRKGILLARLIDQNTSDEDATREALSHIESAENLGLISDELLYYKGLMTLRTENQEKAFSIWEELMKSNRRGEVTDAIVAQANFLTGALKLRESSINTTENQNIEILQEASERFAKALEFFPDNCEYLLYAGICELMRNGSSTSVADDYFKRLLSIQPQNTYGLLFSAVNDLLSNATDSKTSAAEKLNQLLKLQKKPDKLSQTARVLLASCNLDSDILLDELEQFVSNPEMLPFEPAEFFFAGVVKCAEKGKFDLGIQLLDKLLKKNLKNEQFLECYTKLLCRRAVRNIQNGDIEGALIDIDLAAKNIGISQEEKASSEVKIEKEQLGTATLQTLVVSKLGGGQCTTIGEAIKNAQPDARILVQPGLYNEGFVIDKPLEILGDGPVQDIVIESTESSCILMQTSYSMVRGITLRGLAGSRNKECYAVDIPQGQLVLENCDISSDSIACVAIHGSTANPVIRRCQIHDGKQVGVFVWENGEGTIVDCDIFSNSNAGVVIWKGGNPVIRRCQIHDGKQSGVFVNENGGGMMEDCNIFGNAMAGVRIRRRGNPVIRQCRINRNGYKAVWVYEHGAGTVENCDLADNARGAWDIEDGCQVRRSGNIE